MNNNLNAYAHMPAQRESMRYRLLLRPQGPILPEEEMFRRRLRPARERERLQRKQREPSRR